MQALRKEVERYTYADYCKWDDDERWELINGEAYAMAPAPAWEHQEISGTLHAQLWQFLDGKPCKVFAAPFDVRLNADSYDDTVVQPDIVVICDRAKLSCTGCKGAPDMVIEILSPSTTRHDTHTKFRLYQESGVREYWIVYPDAKIVTVHVLENGKYYTSTYTDTDTVPVHVLEGCEIVLEKVFAG